MIDLQDIHPLTAFLRDHRTHLDRLEKTGRPEVLTVNGKARVVVQDAVAYQKLLDQLELLSAEETLRQRIASLEAGERGVPASEVLADIRKQLGIKKG
jgi:PHD/YefM family antitoxin component YafN of YafNO toxin-antitoxin module